MAKKKKQKKKKKAPVVEVSAPVAAEPRLHWPDTFSSPRVTAAILAVILVAGIGIYIGGATGSLIGVKKSLAEAVGMFAPELVSPGVWQVACVLWLGVLVGGLGLIHPVLGVTALLFFRPWIDGYTYPTDNLYFVWGIYYLLVIWAVRMLLRGEAIRHKGLNGLLLLYIVIAALTASASYEWGQTIRALILWSAYAGLFFLVTQSLQGKYTFKILMVALVLAVMSEAAYGVVHYHYTLPALRYQLAANPQMRLSQFGTTEFTPELIRRFNINRAFGTMLFPNTLAGLLLLGLPATAGWAIQAWKSLHAAPAPYATSRPKNLVVQALSAAAAGLFLCLILVIVVRFIGLTKLQMDEKAAWFMKETGSLVTGVLCGGIVGGGVFLLLRKRGWVYAMALVWFLLTLVACCTQCWALWLTFSRGAWLALALTLALLPVVIGLYNKAPSRIKAVTPLLLSLGLMVGLLYPGQDSVAQNSLHIPTEAEQVLTEGSDIALGDLADPASFSLRLGYWQTAGAMLLAQPVTGVGLGAYGAAYPGYQALNAGAVREAHNAYLQAFAETGLFGGAVFVAFWACLLIGAFRRIMAQRGTPGGTARWGLFISLCAFLVHAGLDIHFSHPSLMMFCMVLAGLLLRTLADAEADAAAMPSRLSRGTAVALLLTIAYLTGFSACMYVRDFALSRGNMLNVASVKERNERLQIARYLMTTVRWSEKTIPTEGPKYLSATTLMKLIPSPADWHKMGQVAVPAGDGKRFKTLTPEEAITPDTVIFFNDPKAAVRQARRWFRMWLLSLEEHDALFARDPALAAYLAQGFEILAQGIVAKEKVEARGQVWGEARHWAGEAIRRAPQHGSMYLLMGNNLSKQADMESGEVVLALRQDALRYYREAAALSPAWPKPHFRLAQALEDTAILLPAEDARPLLEESKAVWEQADHMARQRGTFGFAQ